MNTKIMAKDFIKEYKDRIRDCDILLSQIKLSKKSVRENLENKIDVAFNSDIWNRILLDEKRNIIQKQCYNQFIINLKEILLTD